MKGREKRETPVSSPGRRTTVPGPETSAASPSPPSRGSYSSQAWISVCSVIFPSRSESIDSESTRTPSAYMQLSL